MFYLAKSRWLAAILGWVSLPRYTTTLVPWSHNSMVNPHGFDNNNGVEISGYKYYWEISQLFIQRYSNIWKYFMIMVVTLQQITI